MPCSGSKRNVFTTNKKMVNPYLVPVPHLVLQSDQSPHSFTSHRGVPSLFAEELTNETAYKCYLFSVLGIQAV